MATAPTAFAQSEVVVQERDLSQIILSIATTIGGIVMSTSKGPTSLTRVTSTKKLTEVFGLPDPERSLAHYSALQFLEEANQLLVKRVVGEGAKYAAVVLNNIAPAFFVRQWASYADGFTTTDGTLPSPALESEKVLAVFYAIGPGDVSNTRVEIISPNIVGLTDSNTLSLTATTGDITEGSYKYILRAYTKRGFYTVQSVDRADIATSTTGGTDITIGSIDPQVIFFAVYRQKDAGSIEFMTRLDTDQTVNNELTFSDTLNSLEDAIPNFEYTGDALPTTELVVRVYDTDISVDTPVEEFDASFEDEIDGFGNSLDLESRINGVSNYIIVHNNYKNIAGAIHTVVSNPPTRLTGGENGASPTTLDVVQGWNDFKDNEQVDVNILINGGYTTQEVHRKMRDIANIRQDAVALLDMPSDKQSSNNAVIYRSNTLNINSNRVGLFTPDALIFDETHGKRIYIPPSGLVAQRIAYTDKVGTPSRSFAGLNRGIISVLGLRHLYDRGERGLLSGSQINYLRFLTGQGFALWEQWTQTSKLSALSYMSVRRITDVIEKSVSRALLYSLQEPNDDFLGLQIVQMVEDYLTTLVSSRDIQANFKVISDSSNNPPNVVGGGQRNVDVYFTPVLPANRILLTVVITRQGADISALLAS